VVSIGPGKIVLIAPGDVLGGLVQNATQISLAGPGSVTITHGSITTQTIAVLQP
jgi:hypothetical protein